MASLWKHPNSNYYTACFTDIHNRQRKRSTKVEVVPKKSKDKPLVLRKKAQAIADEYEAIARGHRSAAKIRSVILELQALVSGDTFRAMTINRAVEEWLGRRKAETSDATIKFYTFVTGKLTKFLGSRADHDISTVTRQDIFNFRASRLRDVTPSTVNHEVKALRMFFKAAKLEGWVSENPLDGVESVKVVADASKEERRPFTMEEVEAVLVVADEEWKSLITCGLYTLQRLGDLCRLPWKGNDNWSGVFFDQGYVRLIAQKTGKKMTIPMAPPLRDMLKQRREEMSDADLVHPGFAELIKGTSGRVSKQFGKLLIQAKLRVQKEKLEGSRRASYDLSFHCLRHAGISMMKAAGIPQSVVMELAGHSTVEMSNTYTHTGEAALLAAVNSLPQLGGSTLPPEPAPPTDAPS
jgi:integrase